jgi:hypothetical protein
VCIRFHLLGVYQFESPRLSNMGNRLSCGCHNVDNLMALMVSYDGIVIITYLFANFCLISLDDSF